MNDISKSGTDAASKLIESSTIGAALVFVAVVLGSVLALVVRAWLKDRSEMGKALNARISEGQILLEKTNSLAEATADEQREEHAMIGGKIDALAEQSLPDDKLLKYMMNKTKGSKG